jgi:transcriptional regulator with XRE-family HTH domain
MAVRIPYNRIKVVLAEKRRSNNDLAAFLGSEPATVSKWVTNTTQPSVQTLFQIAEFLNVEARELLETRARIIEAKEGI